MTGVLSQYLLGRAPVRAIDAIGHLGGMQYQAPLAPYVGLWTRLRGFAPGELSELTQTRQVVQLHLMRNTVHLVSARDCLDWCAVFHQLRVALPRALSQQHGHGRHQRADRSRKAAAGGAAAHPVDALVLRCLGAFGPVGVPTSSCGPV